MYMYQQNNYLTVIGIHLAMHLVYPNYSQINTVCVCVCVSMYLQRRNCPCVSNQWLMGLASAMGWSGLVVSLMRGASSLLLIQVGTECMKQEFCQ